MKYGVLWLQGKKLPDSVINDEGDVTDEDEGAESDKKRNSKKVTILEDLFFLWILEVLVLIIGL